MAGIKIIASLILGDKGFKKGITEAKSGVKSLTVSFANMGNVIAKLGMFALGRGILNIGKNAVEAARTFEDNMLRTGAVAQATAEEYSMLRQEAMRLGEETRFSSAEVAKGMQYLAMAGQDAEEIMQTLPPTLDLAKAAMVDLGTAADQVTNLLSGFGLGTEKTQDVVDLMAQTMRSSNVDMQEFYQAAKTAGPQMRNLGIDIQDTAVAIGILGNAGIKGSEAGTALRQSFSRLLRAPKEVRETLDDLGIAVNEQTIAQDGLIGTLQRFSAAGASATDMVKLFGRHSAKMSTIVNANAGDVQDLTLRVNDYGGASAAMTDAISPLTKAIELFKSTWENAMISMLEGGGLEFFTLLVQNTRSLIKWLKELSTTVKVIAPIIAVSLGIMTGGISVMTTAIAALIAGGAGLIAYWDDILAKIEDFVNKNQGVKNFLADIAAAWKTDIALVKKFLENLVDQFMSLWNKISIIGKGIKDVWTAMFDDEQSVGDVVSTAVAALQADTDQLKKDIAAREKAYEALKKQIEKERQDAKNNKFSLAGAKTGNAGDQQTASGKKFGTGNISRLKSLGGNADQEVASRLKGYKGVDKESLSPETQAMLENIKSLGVEYNLGDLFNEWEEAAKSLSNVMSSALTSAIGTVSDALVSLAENGEISFGSLASSMLDGMRQIINGLLAQAIAGLIAGESVKGLWGIIGAAAAIPLVTGLFNKFAKFEHGGILGGSTRSGDKTLFAGNAGEMILNTGQQARLLGLINSGGSDGGSPKLFLRGEDIWISGQRYNKNKGEVT